MCRCLRLNTVSFRPCAVSQLPYKQPFLNLLQPPVFVMFSMTWAGCMLARKEKDFFTGAKGGIPSKVLHWISAIYAGTVVRNKRSCIRDRVCAPSVVSGVEFLTSKMLNDFLFHVCISGKDFWKRNSPLASHHLSKVMHEPQWRRDRQC